MTSHTNEALQVTYPHPGIELWTPAGDVLHTPDITPQPMGCDEVLLGLPYGECGGVKMANEVIEKIGSTMIGMPIYGNHQPTHGADATAAYERGGAQFGVMPDAVGANNPYVISAHGAAPWIAERAKKQGLRVFDATCPLVHRTHVAINRAADTPGGHVAYISFGKPDHPERIGAAGAAEANGLPFTAIGSEDDVEQLVESLAPGQTITVVGQTTNNSVDAGRLAALLQKKVTEKAGITVRRQDSKDVCHTVSDRQHVTREIVDRGVDALVVVGSVLSKNTKSLATVAIQAAYTAGSDLRIYLANSHAQLPELSGSVGVVSGASTRAENVHGVIARLAPGTTREVGIDTDKNIVFRPVDAATRKLIEGN